MSGGMNLYRQSHNDYNHKNYNDNVFNITDKTQDNEIILLQFNSDNSYIIEDKVDEADVEYMFLTETLRWKEGLNKENDPTLDADTSDVTKLAK